MSQFNCIGRTIERTVVYHLLYVSIRNITDPGIDSGRDCVRVGQIDIDHIGIVKTFHRCRVALSGQHVIVDVDARSDI